MKIVLMFKKDRSRFQGVMNSYELSLRVLCGQDERFLRNNTLKKNKREAVISKRSDFGSIFKKEN